VQTVSRQGVRGVAKERSRSRSECHRGVHSPGFSLQHTLKLIRHWRWRACLPQAL